MSGWQFTGCPAGRPVGVWGVLSPLYAAPHPFVAELAALGIPSTYAEWPGKHDWKYWHAHVGESLRWLAERIAR